MKSRPLKLARLARTVLCAAVGVGGCMTNSARQRLAVHGPAEAPPPGETVSLAALSTLWIGMSQFEVGAIARNVEYVDVTTSSADSSPGFLLTLPNGIRVVVAFAKDDPAHDAGAEGRHPETYPPFDAQVYAICTNDPRVYIVDAIGIGSTYENVRTAFPNGRQRHLHGYGHMVETLPNVWLRFCAMTGSSSENDGVWQPVSSSLAEAIEIREDI